MKNAAWLGIAFVIVAGALAYMYSRKETYDPNSPLSSTNLPPCARYCSLKVPPKNLPPCPRYCKLLK